MGTVAVQPECLPMPRCDEAALMDIVERAMHSAVSEWLFLRELRVGTGRQNGGAQRLDAFALNTLPHMAMKRVCYEVKTSRADFLSELKHPLKRRIGMRYSNEFYFVTPVELVAVAEIPPECGLVEAGYATFLEWKGLINRHAGFFNYDPETRAYCMITVPAPWRDTPGPTWQLVAACCGTSAGSYLRHRLRDQYRSVYNSSREGTMPYRLKERVGPGAKSRTSPSFG